MTSATAAGPHSGQHERALDTAQGPAVTRGRDEALDTPVLVARLALPRRDLIAMLVTSETKRHRRPHALGVLRDAFMTARAIAEHALLQLTLVRFREFMREPEAVFWVFIFPILLATGLGIAFRNRPADVVKIGAVGSQLAGSLRSEKSLSVEVLDRASGEQALRAGRIVLLAVPAPDGGVTYRYDDTNLDSRVAKLLADRAVQRAYQRWQWADDPKFPPALRKAKLE